MVGKHWLIIVPSIAAIHKMHVDKLGKTYSSVFEAFIQKIRLVKGRTTFEYLDHLNCKNIEKCTFCPFVDEKVSLSVNEIHLFKDACFYLFLFLSAKSVQFMCHQLQFFFNMDFCG